MAENRKHYTPKVLFMLTLILCLTVAGCELEGIQKSIDAETVDGIISRAKPLIEEITGRKFKTDIEYRIVSRHSFKRIFTKYSLSNIREFEKEQGMDMLKRQIEMRISAGQRSQFYIARHIHSQKIIYILHNNIKPIKKLYEIGDEELSDFLFIIIAHEMLHALDHQYYDLAKLLREGKNSEDVAARGAVIGGSAAIVTREIAKRMNISEDIYKKSLMLDICMKDESNPRVNEYFNLYYVNGEKFMQAVIDKRGMEGYGTAFLSPPGLTRQIYNPEEYLEQIDSPIVDCENLVKKAFSEFPETDGMRSQTTVFGAATIKGTLITEGISEEKAGFMADNCLDAATKTSMTESLDPKFVTLTVFYFKNHEAASEYSETMKLIEKSKDDQHKARLNITFELIKDENLHINGYDCVRIKKARIMEDGKTINKLLAVGITDRLYIVIEGINMDESTEEKVPGIFGLIYSEHLKMKQESASVLSYTIR